MRYFAFHGKGNSARRFRQAHFCQAISQELTEDAPCTGQASFEAETQNQSRREGAGCRGLSFSMLGSTSASTMPTAGNPAI